MLKKCRLRSPCRCGATDGLILPGAGPHYGRLNCWQCGRHQKWLGRHDYQRALSKGLVNTLADVEVIASL